MQRDESHDGISYFVKLLTFNIDTFYIEASNTIS